MQTKPASALYHTVKSTNNFDQSSKSLFQLIIEAQNKTPNTDRHIYLDIEGHRNERGGFDHDMFELQSTFIGFILPYIKSISTPLCKMINPKKQINSLPFTDLTISKSI
jgi:hypothetical protein